MRRARSPLSRSRSLGQALAESLVAVIVLVPLWWFAAHWRTGFDQRVDLLRQSRVAALSQALSARDRPADVVDIRPAATPAVAGRAEQAALALIAPVTVLSPGRTGFERNSWLVVTVRAPAPPQWVRLSSVSHWQETLQLLVDDWSLAGPAAVAQRVDALRPSTPLDHFVAALQPIAGPLALLGADVRGACARRIDPEIVPADRLAVVNGPDSARHALRPATGWRPAC